MNIQCETCGNNFKGKRKQRYCCKMCIPKKSKQIIKICELENCNNTFCVYSTAKQPKRFCSRKCQSEWQKIKNRGSNNPNYGNRKPGMFRHTEETKLILSKKIKDSWKKEERLIKHLRHFDKHRNEDGSMDWHDREFREKISQSNIDRLEKNENNFSYKNCIKGFILNTKTGEDEYFHSSWELERMVELNDDKNVKTWTKKHGIHISYFYNKSNKSYLPDFYIEYIDGKKVIEEVKGYVEDEDILKLKIIAGKEYCKKNNYMYVIDYRKNKKKYKHLIEWEKGLK